jgi:probable O-glycosylation ligase (exosortase A-associated)
VDFKVIVSQRHIVAFVLVTAFIILGFLLPFVPEKIRYASLMFGPMMIIGLLILRNPYYGIFAFMFYTFLRPYDFIPLLRVVRFTLLIEVITFAGWLIKLVIARGKIKWNTFSWYYFGFMVIMGITVLIAENRYFAYNAFEDMFVIFLIYVIAIDVVDSPARFSTLIWLLLLIHAYFALVGINTFITGGNLTAGQYTSGEVSGGYIGDENDFALVMNMMIPFAFFGIFYYKKAARLVCILLLLIFVFAIIGSFSRGGFVGLICLLFYFILSSKRKILSFGVLILITLAMFLFAPASYWQEARSIQDIEQGTAHERIRYWEAGIRMFIDHPVIGVGANNSGVHLPMYIKGGNRDPNTEWGRALHGSFPQILADLGVAGSFFYFAMMVIAFKLLYRIKNQKTGEGGNNFYLYMINAIIGSLIGYFVCSIFLSTVYYPYLWTIYIFVIILQQLHNSSQLQSPATAG